MKNWKRWVRYALPIYWLILFAATHYPLARIPVNVPQSDKIVHFFAFGLLALLFWGYFAAKKLPTNRFVWIAALVMTAYGALDEYLQQFVRRGTDPVDWAADTAGALCVLTVLELHRRRQRRNSA